MALRDGVLIEDLRKLDSLQWFAELGIGYYPVAAPAESVYGDDYFQKYEAYAATPLGEKLNVLRVGLVRRHYDGELTDVGIGSGSFIAAMDGETKGYDISLPALKWLNRKGLFHNPYTRGARAVTMWDSMEHIENFPVLLGNVRYFVFMSLPIFTGLDHVLRSRHYRKNEHCWYFTEDGLLRLMARLGWALLESNDAETRAGRDGIGSFAFRKNRSTRCT